MRHVYPELAFFEMALRRSDCLRRCKKDKLAGRPESVDQEIMEEFDKLQPYDYLQICAYKSGDYKTAAAASFTFLLANPNHETMQKNVQFYRTLSTVSKDDFYNMELKKHQDLYMKGVDSYAEKRYSDTIRNIEAALLEYYKEYSHCSALCEGSYDHESFPDFYNALADHWVHVLRCKQQCPIKLATINGALVDSFLVEHYNYLQFSYYQEKDLKEAAACAATYLLMKPNDETMKQNKEFYLTMEGLKEGDFSPRMEATDYVHSLRFQQSMLDFVNKRYKFSDADEDKGSEEEKTIIEEESEVIDPNKFRDPSYYSPERRDKEAFGPRDGQTELRFRKRLQELGATLYSSEEQMAGKQRFVVDNLLTEDQCQAISELAKFGYGGYELGKLPKHVKYERYDGLKVNSIKEMIENHTIDTSVAELYFHTIDTIMDLISLYFNVKWPMYIDFVHTACKNPVVDEGGEPKAEYYQKLHSDNCKYREGLPCDKSFPARFWREFTAVMYLNEVDGGEFVFVDDNENVTHKVVPKCGRLVVFNSTDRHGVLAYKEKKRCTIGLWTTLDPSYHDRKVDYAKTAINIVKRLDDNLPLKEFIEPRGIKLNLTEEELNGPERFAVDSVITQEECDALIHLANEGGLSGDGYYNSGASPHTANEMFEGLDVLRAAKLAAQGKVKSEWVKLYMEKSKLVKEIVQRYFKLKTPLYFDYTHLVCRTSMHDKNKIRTDLSHPIHSDNCIIQSDNTCKKAPPAYVQRDYSALLYLNDNFTGGEFIFTHQNMTIQSMVKPWCGFAMAFNAGNYHGVQAVTSGQRCALAAWYTLDKRFDEAAHVKAKNIMNNLEGKPLGPPQSSHLHGEL